MKYTPEKIEGLRKNQIFVFGSNESGIHCAGAARVAYDSFGAKYGLGFGFSGKTFAIPSKDWKIQTLPINVIAFYVDRFVEFAKLHPEFEFLVTKIGCGLANLTVDQIAPLFGNHKLPENIVLPKEFYNFI